MREMDELEDMFASTLGGAESMPPKSVKSNIDELLFKPQGGSRKRIMWIYGTLDVLVIIALAVWLTDSNKLSIESKVADSNIHDSYELVQNDNLPQSTYTHGSISPTQSISNDVSGFSNIKNNDANTESTLGDIDIVTNETPLPNKNKEVSRKKEIKVSPIRNENNGVSTIKNNDNRNEEIVNSQNSESSSIPVASNNKNNTVKTNKRIDQQETEVDYLEKLQLQYVAGTLDNLDTMSSFLNSFSSPKQNKWSVSTYLGVTAGINDLKATVQTVAPLNLRIRETPGFTSSIEFSYPITRRIAVSTGVGYGIRNDEVYEEISYADSAYVQDNMVVVYDSIAGILDTSYVAQYDFFTSQIRESGKIQQTAISIPLYFTWVNPVGRNMQLNLGVGVEFSCLKMKTLLSNSTIDFPDYKEFGMKLQLRPELVYNFNRFGLGVYGRFGYDIKNGLAWDTYSRQRFGTSAGIVLRLKL